MLFPIQRLLEGREPPLCVVKTTAIREALRLMVGNDYSQVPVADGAGKLLGIVSQETIARRYLHVGAAVSLLDLTVDHCMVPATVLTPERDILEALDRLKDAYALVIARDDVPVGILTDYDTTHFFRDLTEDLILVEDIEVTLRQYIEGAFPDEEKRAKALVAAFGAGKKEGAEPRREYDKLSFWEHVHLITAEGNWPEFKGVFEPKELFLQLTGQVREIRNQLAHFRGRPDAVQHDALVQARAWLETRPALVRARRRAVERIETADGIPEMKGAQGKYDRLRAWLDDKRKAGKRQLRVAFGDIEALLQGSLPPSAREHRSWWANDQTSHRQSRAWLAAGWKVADVDLVQEQVEFAQTNLVLMQTFFADLLEDLKTARPGITRAEKTQLQNWWMFSGGRSGFNFCWILDKGGRLRVELDIDTGDKARNKAAFDALYMQRDEIEASVAGPLTWERQDASQSSRVFASTAARVTDPPEHLEQVKRWAVRTTIELVDAFQNRIAGL
jgi:CBS domain-containing protein